MRVIEPLVLPSEEQEIGQHRLAPQTAVSAPPPPARPRETAPRSQQQRNQVIAPSTRTTVGPVGIRGTRALRTAPATPPAAPKNAERPAMTGSRSVHCRAAAGGATRSALTSTTPTVCRPTTTATTVMAVSSNSSRRTGKPKTAALSRSNETRANSFQKRSTNTSEITAGTAMSVDLRSQKRGGLPEEETIQPRLVGVGPLLDQGQEHEPEPEEDRENQAETGVLLDPSAVPPMGAAGDDAKKPTRQEPGRGGTEKKHAQVAAAGEKKGQGDPRKRGVGHGIAEKTLPPQQRAKAPSSPP